jgi:hypothetical protein
MRRFRHAALLRFTYVLTAFFFFSLIGGFIATRMSVFHETADPTIPQRSSFYLYTFLQFEPLALYAMAVFFLAATVVANTCKTAPRWLFPSSFSLAPWIALLVLTTTCVGRFWVHQNFDLCIDESLNDFEAQILSRHHLVANVPEEWQGYQNALSVPYQHYNAAGRYWASGFLPGFAFLNYLFEVVRIDWALSPLLSSLSVLLVSALARRLFPEDEWLIANLAVVFLAASPQFLAMAITKFAWTAHLCSTLAWLWLFTHPNRFIFLFTPIFGALCIGLHQPHVHILVAAPFLLQLLLEWRFKALFWFGFWYLIGGIIWYQVLLQLRDAPLAAGGDLGNFSRPMVQPWIFMILSVLFCTLHALTTLAWSSPLLLPCTIIMGLTWKLHPPIVRYAFVAILVTFFFYLLFPRPQGHGWGFRYLHSVYGLIALVAASGARVLVRQGLGPVVILITSLGLGFSLMFQIPYRSSEIRGLVIPLSLVSKYISQQKEDFVILKTSDFWYGWDLVRNDPWLERHPLVFNDYKLSPEQRAALARQGTVRVIGAQDVVSFGVILTDPAKKPTP